MKKIMVLVVVIAVFAGIMVSCDNGAKIEYRDVIIEPEFAGFSMEALTAKVDELYEGEVGWEGRLHKMQAFIMEIAIHAKTINPNFKIIPQDGIDLAFIDGDYLNGTLPELMALVDGWGIEGVVGSGVYSGTPSEDQDKYRLLSLGAGKFVTDTTTCGTEVALLDNYYPKAELLSIIPYPRIGGGFSRTGVYSPLAEEMFPGKRWATNSDYFWIEDPATIGISGRINNKNINKLKDAQNYLYHINGRPYDAWDTWDDEEEAALDGGTADRTRIFTGYAAGLLVPSEGGPYEPTFVPTSNAAFNTGSQAKLDEILDEYGTEWDWWWRDAGYTADQGRQVWLDTLRNSNYDVIYIDSFYNHRARPENQTPLTKAEVESLKTKKNGGRRQVIAYLSIGSAEQNRWYCQDDWIIQLDPSENSSWAMKNGYYDEDEDEYFPPEEGCPPWLAISYGGQYDEESIVAWWHPEWRDIIVRGNSIYHHKTTGDNTSSIDRILDQGFDGVYLDNVGVFEEDDWEYFEDYWLEEGGFPGIEE